MFFNLSPPACMYSIYHIHSIYHYNSKDNYVCYNLLWCCFFLFVEPVVKVPNQHANLMPQFLPDPRHGFLYMYGPRGDKQMLKKLPFTIPELVANAPCRSSEGMLYTGKKSDTWFILDPLTGSREHVSGIFDLTYSVELPCQASSKMRWFAYAAVC